MNGSSNTTDTPDPEIGKSYGKLTVLRRIADRPRRKGVGFEVVYVCGCQCGKKKQIYKKNLRSGRTKSCGCTAEAGRKMFTTGGYRGFL